MHYTILKVLTTNRQVEARGCAAEGAEGGGGAVAEGGGDTGGGEPVHQELGLSLLLWRARGLEIRYTEQSTVPSCPL